MKKKTMLSDNQKLIINYLKNWAKTHKEPCPLLILNNALTVQMSAETLRSGLSKLGSLGYLREVKNGNRKSFTVLC